MSQVVVLVGFSGAGKSSVARELSRSPSWEAVDLDTEVERRAGKPVAEIIRVEGENRFRALETEALGDCLRMGQQMKMPHRLVVAAGGGVLTREENRRLLSKDWVVPVLLTASEEKLLSRLDVDYREAAESGGVGQVRPLLAGCDSAGPAREKVVALLRERRSLYEAVAFRVNTDFASPGVVAKLIADEFCAIPEAGKKAITLFPTESKLSQLGDVLVVVGDGASADLGLRVRACFPEAGRLVALVDRSVLENWRERLSDSLGPEALFVEIPPGEGSKSLNMLERLADRLLQCGVERADVIVAVGGGVAGDLGGLLASIYMRGVGLVQVGTTVVAQVDSALGGKTGVNLYGGKNIVGTFYPARLVVSDIDFLSTLPAREYVSGLAEVVKYGLVASSDFFEWIECHVEGILERDPALLREMIEFSTATKLAIVGQDLDDRLGKRAILNFGHTVGHALEKLTGYSSMLHGEAVAVGMVVALTLGEKLGVTERGLGSRVETLLLRLGLPHRLPRGVASYDDWEVALTADKKRGGEVVNFVLVEECGRATTNEIGLIEIVRAVA